MNFLKRTLCLALAAVMLLCTVPAVSAYHNVADWADEKVAVMDALGVIPESLRDADLSKPISRLDMCRIGVLCYTAVTGKSVDLPASHPFSDTTDPDAEIAYVIGLTAGYEDGTFRGENSLTRAEAFCILSTFLKKAGYAPKDSDYASLSKFDDRDTLPSWASTPAKLTVGLGVVAGDGSGLNWKGDITCQEALVMFYRAYYIAADANASNDGQSVADLAAKYVGYAYTYGGQKPSTGFDCSGFVYYIYSQFGYSLNPGATNQWNLLSASVEKENLKPGDLVFFSSNGSVSGIFHVGIYIGNGKMVHAANPNKGVVITELSTNYYTERYLGAKRVIN